MVYDSTFVIAGLLWSLLGYILGVLFGKADAGWGIYLLIGFLFMIAVALSLIYVIL